MNKSEMFKAVSNTTLDKDLFDGEYNKNDWSCTAVETQETLGNYDDSRGEWSEVAGRVEGAVAGFKFIGWVTVQIKKGQARRSLTVIDFGDFRMALDFDPKQLNF